MKAGPGGSTHRLSYAFKFADGAVEQLPFDEVIRHRDRTLLEQQQTILEQQRAAIQAAEEEEQRAVATAARAAAKARRCASENGKKGGRPKGSLKPDAKADGTPNVGQRTIERRKKAATKT